MNLLKQNGLKYLFSSKRHRDVTCPWHFNAFMEIILTDEGVVLADIGGEEYRVPAGWGLFIPPFVPHHFSSPEHNRCHVLMFSGSLVSYFEEFLKKNEAKTSLFIPSKESLLLVASILPGESNDVDYIHGQAVLVPLCSEIYDQCGFQPRAETTPDSLEAAMAYINEHFTERITLESVARAVGIHPVTLSRNLTEQGRTNFSSYLNYLRCSYAAALIKSSNSTVSEIAYAVGFGSIRNFNRAFLKIYQLTPTQFRETATI
ncbi:MAG: helix-turn-helix transcriptional regulator [Clostridia bacterium]|nr:helix-turn-helix transcriptional regulator [Clostridia bacterium]